jgi:membrane associated rhomboid family serine protease
MNPASVGFQCPECVAEGRRTQRPARTAFGGGAAGRYGYVTKTLIGLNALMMVLSLVSGGGTAVGDLLFGGQTVLTRWGAVLGYALYGSPVELHGIADGEYYRLVTSMFLHYGVLHLLMNMWALWILGRSLEMVLGPIRFAALYLISGLGGSVAAYIFTSPSQMTAGASGAIFGLFAGLFLIMRKLGRSTSSIVPVLIVNLVFTFAVPGISVAGHLGGMIIGAIVALALAYAPPKRRTLVQGIGCGAVLVILLVATVLRTMALTG